LLRDPDFSQWWSSPVSFSTHYLFGELNSFSWLSLTWRKHHRAPLCFLKWHNLLGLSFCARPWVNRWILDQDRRVHLHFHQIWDQWPLGIFIECHFEFSNPFCSHSQVWHINRLKWSIHQVSQLEAHLLYCWQSSPQLTLWPSSRLLNLCH
jgi:hypothetical protein